MSFDHAERPLASRDWTSGGDRIVFQHCPACHHVWQVHHESCPRCGRAKPVASISSGHGVVHATTQADGAVRNGLREVAPYRLVLVDLDEGFRMSGHSDGSLAVGDSVQAELRLIAGRRLPFFDKDSRAA
jgi:uncharacterized OB-fold protein